jgi:ATP synthase protein I
MSKLDDLKDRILNARGPAEPAKKKEGQHSQANLGIQIMTELAAAMIVGAVLGYWADVLFDTKPVMFMILIFLGIITGLVNAYRVSYGMKPLAHPELLQKRENEGKKSGQDLKDNTGPDKES